MLVLGRSPSQAVLLTGNIRIEVLSVQGDYVRLGFTAPNNVTIIREELLGKPGETKESDVRNT